MKRKKSGQNAFRGLTKYFGSMTIIHHQSLVQEVKKTVIEIHKSFERCKLKSWNKNSRCLTSLYTILYATKMLFKLISFHVL